MSAVGNQNYVLVTPAHNEEEHLERTIRAVVAQTLPPLRWIIVDDGSTDRTSEIARSYAAKVSFISTLKVERETTRAFSKKAHAFNLGVQALRELDYVAIGNLDADVTVSQNYFRDLLREFEKDKQLGIAGGIIYTKMGDRFVTEDKTLDSVAGAVQFFRKECLEAVGGGYLPFPNGGIDAAAEIIARMKGWVVRKFPENKVFEHRQTGTATTTPLTACYRLGRRFHSLGYGLLFFAFRCLYRLADKPVLIGAFAQFWGFLESVIRRRPIEMPAEAVQFLRREQRKKLLRLVRLDRPTNRAITEGSLDAAIVTPKSTSS